MKALLIAFREKPFPVLMMLAVFLGLIYLVVDDTFTTKEITTAIVIGKHYVPETRQSRLYTNANNLTTTSYHTVGENFLIMAENSYGKVFTVVCTPELYYHKIHGDNIKIVIERGILSNKILKVFAIE